MLKIMINEGYLNIMKELFLFYVIPTQFDIDVQTVIFFTIYIDKIFPRRLNHSLGDSVLLIGNGKLPKVNIEAISSCLSIDCDIFVFDVFDEANMRDREKAV